VRLHVTAKRYLCAVEKDYFDKLSAASVYTLSQQGGPMSDNEVRAFAASPHQESAVRLRRWDDSGKVTGVTVRDLPYYRAMLGRIASI
jgi:gamma-butyrobetaine dioxygenase